MQACAASFIARTYDECEDGQSLARWREAHQRYLTRTGLFERDSKLSRANVRLIGKVLKRSEGSKIL